VGVEQGGQVVERLRRGAVGAQDDVLPGGKVISQVALHGLPADDVRIGVGHGARLAESAAGSLEADGQGSAALDKHRGGRETTERFEETSRSATRRKVALRQARAVGERAGEAGLSGGRQPREDDDARLPRVPSETLGEVRPVRAPR
jgi:hypothetical protein